MSKGHWETYALLDGLPDVNVLAILEDSQGHIWLATMNAGITRYDGE